MACVPCIIIQQTNKQYIISAFIVGQVGRWQVIPNTDNWTVKECYTFWSGFLVTAYRPEKYNSASLCLIPPKGRWELGFKQSVLVADCSMMLSCMLLWKVHGMMPELNHLLWGLRWGERWKWEVGLKSCRTDGPTGFPGMNYPDHICSVNHFIRQVQLFFHFPYIVISVSTFLTLIDPHNT